MDGHLKPAGAYFWIIFRSFLVAIEITFSYWNFNTQKFDAKGDLCGMGGGGFAWQVWELFMVLWLSIQLHTAHYRSFCSNLGSSSTLKRQRVLPASLLKTFLWRRQINSKRKTGQKLFWWHFRSWEVEAAVTIKSNGQNMFARVFYSLMLAHKLSWMLSNASNAWKCLQCLEWLVRKVEVYTVLCSVYSLFPCVSTQVSVRGW